jgi:uncharacterized protein YggU (UPF0235/DUF167 family)
MPASPVRIDAHGVTVAIKAVPGARRAGIGGVETDAAGQAWLRVAVTKHAEGGRANAALIRLIAREWRLPATSISIATGTRGRRKQLRIACDPTSVAERIRALAESSKRRTGRSAIASPPV